MTKLIILCDCGLDDAVAITYILERANKFKSIDILPVAGNFSLATSFNNAKRVLKHFGQPKNVRLVDTSEIEQPFENLYDIHGNDGIGDILPNEAISDMPCLSYGKWIKTVDASCTLLSLGPCTVTLDILRKIGSMPLILMAGNISEPPNYNGYEFNHALDLPAFAECTKYPHVAATLDSCHHPLLDFYNINIEGDSLFARFARRSVDLSRERNERGAFIYDLIAAYYIFNKNKFKVSVREDKDGNKVSVLNYIGNEPVI